ncbi:MAG: hypothetical protein GXZ01_09720 [Clostridiaceae bacterium]|nr:hypothetical protein [Clostridiaceae bacterium]
MVSALRMAGYDYIRSR